jgi:3'(2'), 5'-bisphosphate nucleotidase
LDDRDLRAVKDVLVILAQKAGEAILACYGTGDAVAKSDGSPLTAADLAANQLIVDGLARSYPGVPILSEESVDDPARTASAWCFLVDPLDGTKEFLARNGEFTVNIALVHLGQPVVGVILAPVAADCYAAWKGGGAWRSLGGAPWTAIACGAPRQPPRMAVSRSHRSQQEDTYIQENFVTSVIPMGSSLKGCLVARGDAEVYLRSGRVMEWDIAAMHAIVVEAGGRMTAWPETNHGLTYNKTHPAIEGFLCSC